MSLFFMMISLLVSAGVNAATCLDVSGTYDTNFYGGLPKCAQGVEVEKSWFKYQQVKCEALAYSKVYKLKNGTFCESHKFTFITDGKEQSSANPDYTYKIELFTDKQITTNKSVMTGNITTSIKTIDLNGNLIIDDSSGYHEVFNKSTIQ